MPFGYWTSVTLHVLAALSWLGGMFFLGLVGAPALRQVEPASLRQALFHAIGLRARTVGWIAIVILLITGPINLAYKDLWRWEGVFGSAAFWGTSSMGVSLAKAGLRHHHGDTERAARLLAWSTGRTTHSGAPPRRSGPACWHRISRASPRSRGSYWCRRLISRGGGTRRAALRISVTAPRTRCARLPCRRRRVFRARPWESPTVCVRLCPATRSYPTWCHSRSP